MSAVASELGQVAQIFIADLELTGERDLRGAPSKKLYTVFIESGTALGFVYLYDIVNQVNPGSASSTPPDFVFKVPASSRRTIVLQPGTGHTFVLGISAACTVENNWKGAVTNPAQPIKVTLTAQV